jgi:hypothetical protein
MLEIKQITPSEFLSNQHRLDEFLKGKLSNLVNENYWMTEWGQIAQRFQLFKLKDLSNEEILSYEWDKNYIDGVVEQTYFKATVDSLL